MWSITVRIGDQVHAEHNLNFLQAWTKGLALHAQNQAAKVELVNHDCKEAEPHIFRFVDRELILMATKMCGLPFRCSYHDELISAIPRKKTLHLN